METTDESSSDDDSFHTAFSDDDIDYDIIYGKEFFLCRSLDGTVWVLPRYYRPIVP